jgi:hypothetical protein
MIGRCTYPSSAGFAHYQARGIAVCDRWRDFVAFLADMGERPAGTTLERIDNLRGYESDNCRWATRREQANNRVTNKHFDYQGQRLTFAELVRATGMDKELLRHRLLRAGWSLDAAINTPKSQGRAQPDVQAARRA